MKTFAVCSLLVLLALPAAGVEPYLVKDIDTVPGASGSDPSGAVTFDGAVFFFAADGIGITRRQLWRSDGTAGGTFQVSDAEGGLPQPQPLAVTERLYFFLANLPLGSVDAALWVTDGTPAGTVRLTEPGVAVVGGTRLWVASQGVLYFTARDAEHGAELWRSDGTPAGTYLAADVRPGTGSSDIRELTEYRGRVWFAANDGQHGGALWSSDGTGAVLAVDPVPSSARHAAPDHLRVVGNRIAFFAFPPGRGRGRQLWAGDGTAQGTHPITSLAAGRKAPAVLLDSVIFGNRLLFVAEDRRGEELWVSDGTARGTQPLTGFAPVDAFPFQEIRGRALAGRFVFTANDGSHGDEPWITDGTPQGTRLLADVCPGECSSFSFPERVFGGRLYLTVTKGFSGRELWVTDGTPQGTRQLSDFCSSTVCGSMIFAFFEVAGRLLFVARDGDGWEIWRTDGTAAGTVRVTDFADPYLWEEKGFHGAVVDGQLLFGADDGEHGDELWRTDGTDATPPNTWLVDDINQLDVGGSFPTGLRALGGEVVFGILDGGAPALWKSDGTAAGTVPFRTFEADELDGAHPHGAWAQAGGRLFYFSSDVSRNRYVPWRTDGTAAGTFRLTGEGAASCCERQEMEAVGSTVFFDLRDQEHGHELWASDGIASEPAAGTRLVLDIQPGPADASPQELTAFQGKLFFSANGPEGTELWQSDGTAAGTVPVADVNPGADGSRPRLLTVHAGRLWFFAEDGEHGRELWSSDGTEAGTRLEVELLPDAASYESLFMSSLGDRLVFALYGNGIWVSDGTGTRKIHARSADSAETRTVFQGRLYYVSEGVLWSTDGTEAGTGPLLDRDGHPVFGAFRFAALGSRLVFIAVDQTGHLALWQSDGTPAGTFPLHPPAGIADPNDLVRAGDRVFLSGYDWTTGSELWAVREDAAP